MKILALLLTCVAGLIAETATQVWPFPGPGVAASVAFAGPNIGNSFNDHFTGTSLPAGWTSSASGGRVCMNGTLITGTGTCTTFTNESVLSLESDNDTDTAFVYRAFDRTVQGLWWVTWKASSTSTHSFYMSLIQGTPTADTLSNVSGTFRLRTGIGNVSGQKGVATYNIEGGSRTDWDDTTRAWAGIGYAITLALSTDNYYTVVIQNDPGGVLSGLGEAGFRVAWINQPGTGISDPDLGTRIVAMTSWVAWSVVTQGNDDMYLVLGDQLNDFGPVNDLAVESAGADLGDTRRAWVNGLEASGSAYHIRHVWGNVGTTGLPTHMLPEDLDTVAAQAGGGNDCNTYVKDPYVLFDDADGGKYYMLATCNDGTNLDNGLWTDVDGLGAWTQYDSGNRIIAPDTGMEHAYNPMLVKDETASASERWQIYLSQVDDGLSEASFYGYHCADPPDVCSSWTEFTNPILGVGAQSWNDEGSYRSRPIFTKGGWFVLLSEKDVDATGSPTVGSYATVGTGLDDLTRSAVILVDTAGTNCDTEANGAVTNSRSMPVDSSTGCNADQFIVADNDTNGQNYSVNKIQSVVGNTLTMYHEWDVPDASSVRGYEAWVRFEPQDLIRVAGADTYILVGTCFHAHGNDAGVSSALETTCTLTSTGGEDGPYTFNHPVLPLTAGFDYGGSNDFLRSHENLAFLARPIDSTITEMKATPDPMFDPAYFDPAYFDTGS